MTGKVRENSKRQMALAIFKKHIPDLKPGENEREWRTTVMSEIEETVKKELGLETSPGSMGAIYNDCKWYYIQRGECPEFGRFRKGSNGSSMKTQIKKVAQAAYDAEYEKALPKNFDKLEGEDKEKAIAKAKEKAQKVYDTTYAAEEKRILDEKAKAKADEEEAKRIRKEAKEEARSKRHDDPDGMKWKIVNKETGEVTGYSPTKAAATKLKTDEEKVIKIDEEFTPKPKKEPEAAAPAEGEEVEKDTDKEAEAVDA